MRNFLSFYKGLNPSVKKISFIIFLTYFFVLFSYPLVRSASSAIFYEHYTSADYSFASFVGVIALMVMIFINNKLQSLIGVHKLFVVTGFVTMITLALSFYFYQVGFHEMAYVIFATKEAYIVLLVHTCLAFSNVFYNLDDFKRLIGPIGASGSIGGIVGGFVTAELAKSFGTNTVFYCSLIFILISVICFYFSKDAKTKGLEPNKSITPLKAVRGVKKYVALIAGVVTLSQFVIFIADLQFNTVFEQVVTTKDARTAYLGQFYSIINIVALAFQFILLPYLLVRVRARSVFLAIPIMYLVLVFGGLNFGMGYLFVIASVFIVMKGTDYSVFAAVKEVMFHPLLSLQKFGAKYITDMFIYRTAKALIAFLMAYYQINNMTTLSIMQFIFLSLWIVCVILLFKEQKKIHS